LASSTLSQEVNNKPVNAKNVISRRFKNFIYAYFISIKKLLK
jgi:hypothetical protein